MEEIARLGAAMAEAAAEHETATGIGAIRVLLFTGFRRMEGLGLERAWVRGRKGAVCLPDTKSDFQVRAIGRSAAEAIKAQPCREGSEYIFPADVGEGHFIGVVRVLQRVCKRAKLTDVTPHTLRHTFVSVAGALGFSEPTIAGLLGQAPRGVTQGYVHPDRALVVAADQAPPKSLVHWTGPFQGRQALQRPKFGCAWQPGRASIHKSDLTVRGPTACRRTKPGSGPSLNLPASPPAKVSSRDRPPA